MHTESHRLKKALPTRLTDFGASHCLGLPGRSAPQGATACSSALRKTQLIPGRTTIPSMLLDTCRSQLKADFSLFSPHSVLSVIARFPVSFEVQKKKSYRWPLGSHVQVGERTIPPLRHSRRTPLVKVSVSALNFSWLLPTRCSPEAGAINSLESLRSTNLERLDWERGRWDGLSEYPTPPIIHTAQVLLRGGSTGS